MPDYENDRVVHPCDKPPSIVASQDQMPEAAAEDNWYLVAIHSPACRDNAPDNSHSVCRFAFVHAASRISAASSGFPNDSGIGCSSRG
jgi:hypothetical protein